MCSRSHPPNWKGFTVYTPRKSHSPGTRLRSLGPLSRNLGGSTARASARAIALQPGILGGGGARVPPGMVPGAAIAFGLWSAWNWYQSTGYQKLVETKIIGPWHLAAECHDGGPTPGLTYTISNIQVVSRTGNAMSVLCNGTTPWTGYLGTPWPPAEYLNRPTSKSFSRQWTFQRNFHSGLVDERGKYKEVWLRHGQTDSRIEKFGPPPPPPLPSMAGVAPGLGPPPRTVVGRPPYVFVFNPPNVGSRPRDFVRPVELPQVSVIVTPNFITVRPDSGGREHKPDKKSRERKLRGKRMATFIFWLWNQVDDWKDFLDILAKNSGWKRSDELKIASQLRHLMDLKAWDSMDWLGVVQDGVGWYLDEMLAAAYSGSGDRLARALKRDIKLGTDIVFDPLYEAALGSQFTDWIFETVGFIATGKK